MSYCQYIGGGSQKWEYSYTPNTAFATDTMGIDSYTANIKDNPNIFHKSRQKHWQDQAKQQKIHPSYKLKLTKTVISIINRFLRHQQAVSSAPNFNATFLAFDCF